MPFSIKSAAILIVFGDVQEYLNTPVSWTIPVYRHSATALSIFSLFKRVYITSAVELASASRQVSSVNFVLVTWWSIFIDSLLFCNKTSENPSLCISAESTHISRSNSISSSTLCFMFSLFFKNMNLSLNSSKYALNLISG